MNAEAGHRMHAGRRWALIRYGLAIALTALVGSGALYPGGTVLDGSTRGYSFTHNFLSDLGSTVAFNDAHNMAGARLFTVALIIGVAALAASFVAAVRVLSATAPARVFARLAAAAGVLVCGGFVVVALAPVDRAFALHIMATRIAIYAFPVGTALLGVATWRDARFGARAMLGWWALAMVLVSFILVAHIGPRPTTEHGLTTQVLMQKLMAATVLAVLWIESVEAERVARVWPLSASQARHPGAPPAA